MQLPPPQNSARTAIVGLCKVLNQHGVRCLDPETIRQAKFNGPVAPRIWQGLHDLVLVHLAGYPEASACHTGLARVWSQAQLEDTFDGFPSHASRVVLHYLSAWGAPPPLLAQLQPPEAAASRPLLLVLTWLVAHCSLFERALQALRLTPDALALLPPYPQDTSSSAPVQQAYLAAAQAARQHVERLLTPPAAPPAAAGRGAHAYGAFGGGLGGSSSSSSCWDGVECAAMRAVALYGKARSKAASLQASLDARHRLAYKLWAAQAASRPLTPYELQLCAQPALLQRHVAGLEAAALALVESLETASAGQLFFQWAESVVEEEAAGRPKAVAARQAAAAAAAAAPRHPGAAYLAASKPAAGGHGRPKASLQQQQQQAPPPAMLSSLQQLPDHATPAAARLLKHLQEQVHKAASLARPLLQQTAGQAQPGAEHAQAAGQPQVTMQHFEAMAQQAVAAAAAAAAGTQPGGSKRKLAGPGGSAPAPALQRGDAGEDGDDGEGGGVPHAVLANEEEEEAEGGGSAWRPPGDVSAAVAAIAGRATQRRREGAAQAAAFRHLRYAALLRYDQVSAADQDAALRQAGRAGATAAAAAAAAAVGGPGGVAAGEEAQRLLREALAVARPLAKARAAHKAALMSALEGAQQEQRLMVLGL